MRRSVGSPDTRVKKPRLVFAVVRYSRSCMADIDVTTPAIPWKKFFFFSLSRYCSLSAAETWACIRLNRAEDSDRTDRPIGGADSAQPHHACLIDSHHTGATKFLGECILPLTPPAPRPRRL